MPAAVLPVPCTPVCPCENDGMPVASSAICLALSNIIMFSLDTFGYFVPNSACPGAPPCLLNTFPGYKLKSCPGTKLVSSISNIRLPDKTALSTAILIKPFIKV